VTAHPYGGSSGQNGGAAGGHQDVEGAHAATGLPVYVTEVGWPTAVGQPSTGDSQQWSEAEQAQNMTNFVAWAHSTGFVKMVTFFNAVDYGSNTAYGVETSSRRHKLSFATLGSLN
jgi:exo-beta-1,3-glucanase (GH17 family)